MRSVAIAFIHGAFMVNTGAWCRTPEMSIAFVLLAVAILMPRFRL